MTSATTNINQSITNIANPIADPAQKASSEGGFCNWVREHKTHIAVALLILGVGALTAGIGMVAAALSAKGIMGLVALIPGKAGLAVALSSSGELALAGAATALAGLVVTSFSSGMFAGIPSSRA